MNEDAHSRLSRIPFRVWEGSEVPGSNAGWATSRCYLRPGHPLEGYGTPGGQQRSAQSPPLLAEGGTSPLVTHYALLLTTVDFRFLSTRRDGTAACDGRFRRGRAVKASAKNRRDRVRTMLTDLKMPRARRPWMASWPKRTAVARRPELGHSRASPSDAAHCQPGACGTGPPPASGSRTP